MKKIAFGILVLVLIIGAYMFFIGAPTDNNNTDYIENTNQYAYSYYFYEDEYIGDDDIGYIVEEAVDGPDDCIEFEEYDQERGVCFFECSTQEQCDKMQDQIDTALDTLGDDYNEFTKGFSDFEGYSEEAQEKAEITYRIDKGENFVIVSGIENANHIKIKNWLADIVPNKFSDTYLSRLILLADTGDGSEAFVEPSNEGDLGQWDMYVNMQSMEEGNDKEIIFTLIHEYAHILTLNKNQISESVDETSCLNYFTSEGCVNENAYLNIFYQSFWKDKFDPFAEGIDNYDKQPSAFVTEYAATNPGEDIAESFAFFIFEKENDENTIAEQKVTFFYFYPELIKMREDIREVLKPIVRKRITK